MSGKGNGIIIWAGAGTAGGDEYKQSSERFSGIAVSTIGFNQDGASTGNVYHCNGDAWIDTGLTVLGYIGSPTSIDSNGDPVVNTVIAKGESVVIANAIGATGAQTAVTSGGVFGTFQATNNASGTDTVVDIEVSNDNVQWIVMGTITLSGNNDTDGFASSASWKYTRANVTAWNAGTVTVIMGG